MNQLDIHKKIDDFLAAGPAVASIEVALELIATNYDARNYFFSTADETWLKWIWNNSLLEVIKKPAEDPNTYSYRVPELHYLVRSVDKDPAGVTEILLSVPITKATFNPEVVDRFLWIAGSLPAEQLRVLLPKMRDEKWMSLMSKFSRSGYEYQRILTKLTEAESAESILVFADAVLQVRSKEEIAEDKGGTFTDNPFYLKDIGQSGVFVALANLPQGYTERALGLASKVMGEIVNASNREPNESVFKVEDSFHLFDVDFFTLKVAGERRSSYREDVRDLAAVLKTLIQKTIGQCNNSTEAHRLLGVYVDSLPDSRSMWRLRLFTLSLCPEIFKEKLKEAFFRLFETDKYHEIDSGTEYQKTLKKAFGILTEQNKREYIARVFSYFPERDRGHPDQKWHLRNGWEIISSISEHLTEEEKVLCKRIFGRDCDSAYEPEPTMSQGRGGVVQHQSPVKLSDYSVDDIIKNLKSEWSAAAFKEKFERDDFLRPRGVEGLGDALKEDLKTRVAQYTEKASSFFDRANIHPHYTYSYLRAIEDMMRTDKLPKETNWEGLFRLFEAIATSGVHVPFERIKDDNWLPNWIAVHDAFADVLLQATAGGKKEIPFDFDLYRDRIVALLRYLFTVDDPRPEDEKTDQGDLFHIAINSVRGRAFQVLTQFVYHDGKDFPKEAEVKIKEDIKEIYESLVTNDRALSVRFVIGHYLATYYYRDKTWVRNLLPKIFSFETDENFYFAALEGYLNSTLYKELFDEMREYYSQAINIDPGTYPERKYTKEIDEALAIHIALAFAHFINFEDSLFKGFWSTQNIEQHTEFVSFLGRHCITREHAGDKWFEENGVSKQRLMDFWIWALERKDTPPKVFSGFGFWINPHQEIFDLKWLASQLAKTMKKAKGQFDWDYGLMEQLPNFAKVAPQDTLDIIEDYLLDEGDINPHRGGWIHVERELRDALDILSQNEETKIRVRDLIAKLVEIGGAQFWALKEVIR